MLKHMNLVALLSACALMSAGCSTGARVLGIRKSAPNEFNIITKPPLIVPPEYNLRPPRTGELDIEEKYSTAEARKALLGEIDPAEPSQGEAVLIANAGGGRADPAVRAIIDGSNSIVRKNRGFADRVMFWRDGNAIGADGQPLDPDSEERRMKAINAATGDGKVDIVRRPSGAKLPGL